MRLLNMFHSSKIYISFFTSNTMFYIFLRLFSNTIIGNYNAADIVFIHYVPLFHAINLLISFAHFILLYVIVSCVKFYLRHVDFFHEMYSFYNCGKMIFTKLIIDCEQCILVNEDIFLKNTSDEILNIFDIHILRTNWVQQDFK
jgi:hypothetical protein